MHVQLKLSKDPLEHLTFIFSQCSVDKDVEHAEQGNRQEQVHQEVQ